jgi:hypothetical protein
MARVVSDERSGDDLVRPDFIQPQKDHSSGREDGGLEHVAIGDDSRGANDERGRAEESRTGGRQAPGPR